MIDNLREKLSYLRLTVWKQTNLNGQANLDHDSVEEVLALIRTEKLKLLSEVRERAIPNPTTPAGDNEFVPLDELTKLEAEL